MKQILPVVAFGAFASMSAFGAACPAGANTLAAFVALPAACQVTASNNPALTWSISNWSLTQASTVGFGGGSNVTPNTNDILVTVTGVTNGFKVSFSDAPNAQAGSNPFNFFAPAATAGNSQQVNWKTGYWVRAVGALPDSATGIDNVILSLENPTGSNSFSVDKQFQDFSGINLTPTDAQVFYSNGAYILGTSNPSSPTSVFNPRRTAGISIVDVVQFNSGQNGSGSLTSYTNTFSVNAVVPQTAISKTHVGNFSQGQAGATYTIVASNIGSGPTNGSTVTVTDAVPAGLTLVSMTGSGWTCVANSCTRNDVLGNGASYPALTVTVNVDATASASVTNSATVSGGGAAGQTANDPTTINPIVGATAQVSLVQSGLGRNRATGLWSETLTVTNTTVNPISGPVQLVLSGLSSNATMTNVTGMRNGFPYVTVLPGGGMLLPGASVAVMLTFQNQTNGFITFTPLAFFGTF